MMGKPALGLLLTLIFFAPLLVATVHFGSAQSGLINFISSDTVWDQPVTCTGPVVVNQNVILTINPGVTVNLNGYYLVVNGTLQAVGSDSNKIVIYGGDIIFDKTAVNCNIQNAELTSSITSPNALLINSDKINGRFESGASTIITNSVFFDVVITGDHSSIINNQIQGDVYVDNECIICQNNVIGHIDAGQSTNITNNNVDGGSDYYWWGGYDAIHAEASSQILNNTVNGVVDVDSCIVSNNHIVGGAPFTDMSMMRYEDATSAVQARGNSIISFNTISSSGGYGVLLQGSYTKLLSNHITEGVRVAGDALIDGNTICDSAFGIQVGHIRSDSFTVAEYGEGNAVIQNNYITNNTEGITTRFPGGSALIQRNLIESSETGITVFSQATILNNTISNSKTAISIGDSSIKISYNNIEGYQNTSIYSAQGTATVDAKNNWWGTIDPQAIGISIHDYKYDLNLAKVTFNPFLAAPNPQAMPDQQSVPETTPNPNVSLITPLPTAPQGGGLISSDYSTLFITIYMLAVLATLLCTGIFLIKNKRKNY
jgi:hypothetical protein